MLPGGCSQERGTWKRLVFLCYAVSVSSECVRIHSEFIAQLVSRDTLGRRSQVVECSVNLESAASNTNVELALVVVSKPLIVRGE